jgi:hypothetical protein
MGRKINQAGNNAQIMVISAIAIGFFIITIAILLNSAYFIGFADSNPDNNFKTINNELFTNGENILEETNNVHRNESYKTLKNKHDQIAKKHVTNYEKQIISQGHAIDIELSSTTNGTLLGQSTERYFTSSSSDSSWTLVSSTEQIRDFSLTIKEGTLVNGSSLQAGGRKTSDFLDADAFRVYIDDADGDTWAFYFYQRNDGIVYTRLETPDGTIHPECQVSDGSGHGTIDITNAIANEQHACSSLRVAEDFTKPVTVRYEDGTNAEGTYNLTVSKNRNLIDTSDFKSPLYADRILYSSEYNVTYVSNKFNIEKIITIKPGDADGDYYDN